MREKEKEREREEQRRESGSDDALFKIERLEGILANELRVVIIL